MELRFSLLFLVSLLLLFHQVVSETATNEQRPRHEGGHMVKEEGEKHVQEMRSGLIKGRIVRLKNGTDVVMYPMVDDDEVQNTLSPMWMLIHDERMRSRRRRGGEEQRQQRWRRQLEPFGVCSMCKCCDDTQSVCSLTACCYSIVCNSPNQPFGLCSLSPSACNCFSCPET